MWILFINALIFLYIIVVNCAKFNTQARYSLYLLFGSTFVVKRNVYQIDLLEVLGYFMKILLGH